MASINTINRGSTHLIKLACPLVRKTRETEEVSLEIRVEEAAMVVLKVTTPATTCSEGEDHQWEALIKVDRPSVDIVIAVIWVDNNIIATFRTK